MRAPGYDMEDPDVNVASLIDMVFLLLVYFMSAATLIRPEADLGIRLPGMLAQAQSVDMADEQTIEVRATGEVVLNGREYDSVEQQDLPELVATLTRYRQASAAAKSDALVTLWADDESRHQRIVDVMNACAEAGITNVTFTTSAE